MSTTPSSVPGKDAAIYTAQTMKRLLLAAQQNMPALLPYVAIGGFAGLRTAEITRLRWEDIRLPADKPDRRFIIVRSENKTGCRVVPVHENLYAWLRPIIRADGFVLPREILNQCKAHVVNDRATNALARLAGVTWSRNALRKSYASYRLAETGNAYTTAEETGHAVAVLKTVYREVCLPEQATEWFGLMPPEDYGASIIPLPTLDSFRGLSDSRRATGVPRYREPPALGVPHAPPAFQKLFPHSPSRTASR